jgi:site-specific DNA recombinase
MQKAIIYCRVSSERQKNEGHGLDSQEHRCREYASQKGYEVERVFRDSFSGGGDYTKRPAMSEMLTYMDSKPYNSYLVVFDDLKRLARDTEQYLKLKKALELRKAKVDCPNFIFNDSPEGKYIEVITAAGAELEREQNRRQVMQKMKARMEMGFYPFPELPVGYKHSKVTLTSNSNVVPKEPEARIIKEALEGYASGRFLEQLDVHKFLKENRINGDKPLYLERVKRILVQSLFYAGWIEYKAWEVGLRKGQHEGIIDLATHEKIQDKLLGKVRHHVKQFLHPDFPLRRFILCSECHHPLTASQSRSRNGQKKPYYRCNQEGCSLKNKSIRKDTLHSEFEAILKKVKPSKRVLNATKKVVRDVWERKEKGIVARKRKMTNELMDIESERNLLLQRLTKAKDDNVVGIYENKLSELAEKEMVLKHSIKSFETHRPNIETALNIVFDFLKNPLDRWQKGDIHRKRLVLRLVFEENLVYNRKSGFETAILSLPLRVFVLPEGQISCLVEVGRMSSRP